MSCWNEWLLEEAFPVESKVTFSYSDLPSNKTYEGLVLSHAASPLTKEWAVIVEFSKEHPMGAAALYPMLCPPAMLKSKL